MIEFNAAEKLEQLEILLREFDSYGLKYSEIDPNTAFDSPIMGLISKSNKDSKNFINLLPDAILITDGFNYLTKKIAKC